MESFDELIKESEPEVESFDETINKPSVDEEVIDLQCGACGKDIDGDLNDEIEEVIKYAMKDKANEGKTADIVMFAKSNDADDKLRELKTLVKLQEL